MVSLPKTGPPNAELVVSCVAGLGAGTVVEADGRDDGSGESGESDGDEDEGMISAAFVAAAGRVEIDTEPG
jgi:hypothetical protein